MRYHFDTLLIGQSKINELEIRQNLLLKRAVGVKKFARFKPMLESIKVESVEQVYMKYKIYFLKQIRQSKICNNLLTFLRQKYDP